jgi:hypothetical protein
MDLFQILVIIAIIILLFLFIYNIRKFRKNNILNLAKEKLRKLWSDHVFWTREAIISHLDFNPDIPIDNIVQRLYKNQDDLSQVFSEHYTPKIGNAVKNLLDEHITIVANLIIGVKTKDPPEKIEQIAENAINNAKTIAINLNKINKKFGSKQDLTKQFVKHVELVFDQIKNPNDLEIFDDALNHILKMADKMAIGFI